MVSAILSRLVILVFGTLYPAYASYKAVRTKNVKEYVKWMMYWIVFALFCAVETFSDFFLSWFPFYYEFKIIFVLWMLSPITQGSSFLFKKFVHPQLARREKDIDEMIEQATRQGYSTFVDLGNKGFRVILNSVIMGQSKLVDHLRRSYSTSDISNDGQDLVQHHEAIGDNEEDREDELDNRLLEDQAELAKRSTTPVTKSRSSSSAVSLSSVKEEEGEDGEHVISETFNIPASTRRHYFMRDGRTATRQQRCQSLPPSADRYTKPLVIASTSLESKRQFFAKFQSVEKKEIVSFPSEQNSSQKGSKRYLLTRSLSQDSGTARRPGSISLFARSSSVETGGLGLTKFSSENKDVKAGESLLIKSDGGVRVQSSTDSMSEADLPEETSLHQNITPKLRPDVLLEKGIGIEKCMEDDISTSRKSVPRFQNELPAIDEVVPLDISPQPAVIDEHRVLVEHSDSQEDSSLLQICENSAGEPKLNLLSLSSFSDDHSNLIFLNPEDDSDDQCPTPVPEDSPANLSQDDGKKDTATGNDAYSENNSKEKDLASTESDNDSVYQFGSVSSIETGSEEHDSSAWETLSEASAADDVDTSSEGMKVASNLKDEFRPWSAPSSPASFIRGSKYEEYESQSVNSPDNLLVHPRSKGKDEFSWMKSKVQRQMSSPSTASRGIIYSWPSPSRHSDPVYSSQPKGRLSDKSYGHSFDPFQTSHPSSRSGATSHYLHSGASSSSVPYSSQRDRSSHYVRSSSLDLGGGETLYGQYKKHAYKTNPLSPRSQSLLGSSLLNVRRFSTSSPGYYPSRSYQSFTSKK